MYNVLLIDLDDTLVDYAKTELTALSYIYEKFFRHLSPNHRFDDFNNEFRLQNATLWHNYRAGNIKIQALRVERFKALAKKFPHGEDINCIVDEYEQCISTCVYLFKDSLQFLQSTALNYKLCIATNGIAKIQRNKLTTLNIMNYFSNIFISEEIGYNKPDPLFFESILQNLAVDNKQVLMIGDSLDSDLIGASKAGIHFCWINRTHIPLPRHYPSPTYTYNSLKALKKFFTLTKSLS